MPEPRDGLLDLPQRYRGGLERWAKHHIRPGHFLVAVLEDRLSDAVFHVDDDVTFDELKALLRFVHNELMPSACHGSPAAVADWERLGRDRDADDRPLCLHCRYRTSWYESQPAATDGNRP